MIIGISGNIGVGKTTFCTKLAQCFKDTKKEIEIYHEPVEENPYLEDFYKNKVLFAFRSQDFFLKSKYEQYQIIHKQNENKICIQDRIVDENTIFAKSLLQSGEMTKEDGEKYFKMFNEMKVNITDPDIILYLRASAETCMKRIKQRGREMEKSITLEYLEMLNKNYDELINKLKDEGAKVIILNWDEIQDIKIIYDNLFN